MATPPYTVDQGVVIDGSINAPAANITGVLRDTDGGVADMYDLLGNPITYIPVNEFGVHSPFGMTITKGTLDFGSVLLPVRAMEANDALPIATAAATSAAAAQALAQSARADALASSISAAQAASQATAPTTSAIDAYMGGVAANLLPSLAALRSGQLWFDKTFAPPAAVDLPLITVQSAPTGTSVVAPTTSMLDTHFRYSGMVSVVAATTGFVAAQTEFTTATPVNRYSFITQSAPVVDVVIKGAMTSALVRVWVNGQPVSLQMPSYTISANTTAYLRLTFPSAKPRKIMVEWCSALTFGGVVVPAGQSVFRDVATKGPRVAILGDSYVGGSGTAPDGTSRLETFAWWVANLLGASDWRSYGIGGTGYVNPGTVATYSARVPLIVTYAPDILIVSGSRNDTGGYDVIRNAALQVLTDLSAISQVYVTGPSTLSASAPNDPVREAALRAGAQFIDGLADPWITDADLGADAVHPTFAGHQRIAKGLYAGIRALQGVGVAVASASSGVAPSPTATATTTALASSPGSSAAAGTAVTLTATVAPSAADGTVTFKDGTSTLGTATVSAGVATLTVTPSTGGHSFTAAFANGSSAYKPSTSAAVSYLISAPSIIAAGSLFMVEPPLWASLTSVPADATTVPNDAWSQCAATIGAGSQASLAARIKRTANTATTLVLERSAKGGLHGMFSQSTTTAAAAAGNLIQADVQLPDELITFLRANPTHSVYVSIWARDTRLTTDITNNPKSIIASTTSPSANYLEQVNDTGALPGSANAARLGASVGGTSTANPQRRSLATSGFQGTMPTSNANMDAFAATWGNSSAQNRVNRGSGASFVLYRVYVEDLTVSGRSFATVDALDLGQFNEKFGTGGVYTGDTFSDPAVAMP